MEHQILWSPSYSTLCLTLNQWETIHAEPWSMVAMDPTASIDWKMQWWFLAWLWRMFLTWESFFTTTITSNRNWSNIFLAPRATWDIAMLEVDPSRNWIVQWGWFLASTSWVSTNSKFTWLKWFFSWEWLFMIQVSWQWQFWVSSFWAIIEYELNWNETFIVDNAHIVAFEDTLDYQIKQAWGWIISWVKTWESLVCEFSWKWKLYFQTRNLQTFTETLNPFLSSQSASAWWIWSSLLWWLLWD